MNLQCIDIRVIITKWASLPCNRHSKSECPNVSFPNIHPVNNDAPVLTISSCNRKLYSGEEIPLLSSVLPSAVTGGEGSKLKKKKIMYFHNSSD